jgi:hypothetical protein
MAGDAEMSEIKKYQISVKGEALIARYGVKSRMATILNGMDCSQLESNFAESELREYLAFLENQNDGLQKYVSELILTVEKLVEVGDALQNQAYDAWLKDGMLDFSAATDWIALIADWKGREK